MSKPEKSIEVLENCFMYQFPKNLEPAQAKSILDYIERLEHKIGELENEQLYWSPVSLSLPIENCYVAVMWHYKDDDESNLYYDITVLRDGDNRLYTQDRDPNKIVTHYMMLPTGLFD